MGNLVTAHCGIRLVGGVNLHEASMSSERGRSAHHDKREVQVGETCKTRVAMGVTKSDELVVVRSLL